MSLQIFGRMETKRPSSERKIVKFAVGDIFCAVDIMHVREIILPRETSPLPSADKSIIGVADHRSSAIPVIDLRNKFQISSAHRAKNKWIIISVGNRNIALVVDTIFGVVSVHKNQKRDHSSLGEGADVSWAKRVYGDADGLLFEIDLEILSAVALEKSDTPL